MTKILLIEEQELFRHSLKSLIQSYDCCTILGAYPSIGVLPEVIQSNTPELILLSIHCISDNAEIEINQLKDKYPLSRIVVISEEINQSDFALLTRLEVYAFFSFHSSPIELKDLLCNYDKFAVTHQMKIDTYTRENLRTQSTDFVDEKIEFSRRELEVLNLVCQEQSNFEISEILGLSVRTIETFRRRMIIKTGCRNMIGVIIKAIQYSEFGQINFNKR